MSFLCSKADLVTESDVEQKLVYPLLMSRDGLGFFPEEIKTKSYLQPLDLDKGAGRKVGYYPDYAILLSALPMVVAEAKAPDEATEESFREAQLYTHELNKRFPPNINPARVVMAKNGVTLLYGSWDSADPTKIACEDLVPGMAAFEDFRSFCQRAGLASAASEIRAKLASPHRWKALKIIGGPAKQRLELPPNRFARDLVPLLRKFFDPDASRTRAELTC